MDPRQLFMDERLIGMCVYCDGGAPKLLNVAGAIDVLPDLTLEPASRAVGAGLNA